MHLYGLNADKLVVSWNLHFHSEIFQYTNMDICFDTPGIIELPALFFGGGLQTRHMVISNNFEGFSMNSALFGLVMKMTLCSIDPKTLPLPISKTFAEGPQ